MKLRLKWVWFILAGILLCGATVIGKEAATPYVVGAVVSVTGPNAPLGTPERDTLVMLEEQINKQGGVGGHPLKLLIEDDGSDNTNAVKAAKKLIEQDKVCALIGSSGTGPTMAMVPVAEAAEIPQVSMAAGSAITSPLKKWVFRTAQTDALALSKILEYLQKKKLTKVAMIYDSNAYGSNGRDQLRLLAPKYNVAVVAEESFATKDTDMTVQLTKVRSGDAQAIICWGTNPAPAQLAKNAQQLRVSIPIFMSHGVANQAFLDQAGAAASGIILPVGKLLVADELPAGDPQKKVLQSYAREFETRFKRPADSFGGYAWDALNIITQALKKAGDNRAKLREAIEGTRKLPGVSGIFSYGPEDHDGLNESAFAMAQIAAGKWTFLKK